MFHFKQLVSGVLAAMNISEDFEKENHELLGFCHWGAPLGESMGFPTGAAEEFTESTLEDTRRS